MLADEVLAYYRRMGERDRLNAAPGGSLEFLRTCDILTRVLPAAPARILDVGGATGRYAARLAGDGYAVHLIDPVPEHVADAAALPGVTAELGDARTLALPDASADAVLLLGPLYHLPDRADRLRAWREAARVLRPGGVVVAATISRYASALDGFLKGLNADPHYGTVVELALETGEHRPPGDSPWFTTAYFHHPDEPAAEAAEAGLPGARVLAVEGPAWLIGRLPEILADPQETARLLDVLRRLEEEPSLTGASSHLVTVARKPAT